MAALPLSEISTSLVASAISEASNDVGTLFCSTKVNPFGFNIPFSSNMQTLLFGMSAANRAKLSPAHPDYVVNPSYRGGYHLGAFRGYDHTWKAYTGSIRDTLDGSEYTEPVTVRINIIPAGAMLEDFPEPVPAIDHVFKIEYARTLADFTHSTSVVLEASKTINYPYYEFDINPLTPPDFSTNGKLNVGDTFYIKVTHLSSPERRWWNFESQTMGFVVPNTAYTETITLENEVIRAIKQTTPVVANDYFIVCDLYADLNTPKTVVIKVQMSLTSDFTTDVYTKTESQYIARNTTPGTQTLVGSLMFDYNATDIKNKTSVGQTVYGKLFIDDVLQLNFSTTVQSTMPL